MFCSWPVNIFYVQHVCKANATMPTLAMNDHTFRAAHAPLDTHTHTCIFIWTTEFTANSNGIYFRLSLRSFLFFMHLTYFCCLQLWLLFIVKAAAFLYFCSFHFMHYSLFCYLIFRNHHKNRHLAVIAFHKHTYTHMWQCTQSLAAWVDLSLIVFNLLLFLFVLIHLCLFFLLFSPFLINGIHLLRFWPLDMLTVALGYYQNHFTSFVARCRCWASSTRSVPN